MFEDIPVEVGLVYEGEKVRKKEMYLELGGPGVGEKFELVRVRPAGEVVDEEVVVIGPDLCDLEPGKSHAFGIFIEVAGSTLEEDTEGVIERRIHEYANYIEGFMHLNQRYDIWCRISKRSFDKGLTSFVPVGKVLLRLMKNELPIIERIRVNFLTDSSAIHTLYEEAVQTYEARDKRARGLRDEEVDTFYGCALCQSFAPTHVCVITPERYANCGAISWFDGRAAAGIDPKGPIFPILKGECIDPQKGEYSGVNESAQARSMGEVQRVWLYGAFGYPHTSCGCFEGIAFYIPETDGFGIVHRGFHGNAPNGLPFSTMADSTAGGRQVDGFHGVSIEYLRSRKFLAADGGYDRVVWMPEELLGKVKEFLPERLQGRIATEKDTNSIPELMKFLECHEHPVLLRRAEIEAEGVSETRETQSAIAVGTLPIRVGGFKIILKNARIYAEKVIIQPVRGENEGRRGE